MPKKFGTENTKAAAAREKRKQAKDEATSKKQNELEDSYWKDDDKHLQKKQQKKESEEKKKQEALRKKAEAKALLEKEADEVVRNISKYSPPVKVTRAQISARRVPVAPKEENNVETHTDASLIENVNRLQIDGEEARTIDAAISILGDKDDIETHPEKRMKAAYTAYEKRRLKELKEEHPSLRLSQLKQMIFKEWQKSPENPLYNQ